MTRKAWFFALVAAQVVFATGCWPFGQEEEEPAGPAPAEGPPLVEVINMHWAPVNVYAIYSGTSSRLGTLTTNQTERFELPTRLEMGGDVRFVVDPVGATYRYTSESVFAQSGLVIVLRVENNLNLSSISIR